MRSDRWASTTLRFFLTSLALFALAYLPASALRWIALAWLGFGVVLFVLDHVRPVAPAGLFRWDQANRDHARGLDADE